MNTPKIVSRPLAEDLLAMIPHLHDQDHRHYTKETVGHEPTQSELLMHFVEHGGLAHYRATHQIRPPKWAKLLILKAWLSIKFHDIAGCLRN